MLSNSDIHLNYQQVTQQIGEETSDTLAPESSANVASPSKKHQSMPAMRSPEKKKVIVLTTSPDTFSLSAGSDFDAFKSPKGIPSLKMRSVTSPADSGDSPRSVKSPGSQRSEHEVMQSSRHRIESPRSQRSMEKNTGLTSTLNTTVTQTVTATVTTPITVTSPTQMDATPGSPVKTASQRLSAPPSTISLNQPSAEQINALADLWIDQLLGSSSAKSNKNDALLSMHQINALGRLDYKVDVTALPDCLQSLKLSQDKLGKVSLSDLLRSLLANHLSQSDAGKTIFAMLTVSAQAHPEMVAIHTRQLTDRDVDEANVIKKKMRDAMQVQVKACVQMIFGAGQQLQQSRLPSSLLKFWRCLDAKLVREAAKNPALTPDQVLLARQNLGFDLLITRQLYPYAMKPAKATAVGDGQGTPVLAADTAPSVMGVVFANAMREELRNQWPSFFADAIRHFDA